MRKKGRMPKLTVIALSFLLVFNNMFVFAANVAAQEIPNEEQPQPLETSVAEPLPEMPVVNEITNITPVEQPIVEPLTAEEVVIQAEPLIIDEPTIDELAPEIIEEVSQPSTESITNVTTEVNSISNDSYSDLSANNIVEGFNINPTDTSSPTVTFNDPVEAGPVTSDNVSVTVADLNLNNFGYAISTDGACGVDETYIPFTNGETLSFSTDAFNGQYFCVWANDTFGNQIWVSSQYAFNMDLTSPVITFTDDVAVGPVQVDNVAIDIFDINFNTYSFIYTANTVCDVSTDFSTSYGPGEFTSAISIEEHNSKYICLKAVDTVGNTSYKRSVNPLNIDATSPSISFTDNVEHGPVPVDYVQISTSDLNLASYNYGFSNDSTCNASDSYGYLFVNNGIIEFNTPVNNGQYICVRSVDSVGNTAYTASAYPLNIDAEAPVIQIMNDVEVGPVNEDIIDLLVTDSNLANLRYYSSDDTNCSTTEDTYIGVFNNDDYIIINTTTLNGKYLCFFATDDVGNITSQVSSNPLNIDNIPPQILKIDNLENRPMIEDRIVIDVASDDIVELSWGYSDDQGCWVHDSYTNVITPGQEFYVNNPVYNGKYLCFRAIDSAGNIGFEQSNIQVNIDTTLPVIYFTNDVSGEYVTFEAIEVIANVGNPDDIHYGFSPDPICEEGETDEGTLQSGEPFLIGTTEHNGEYVCVSIADSTGAGNGVASENPINTEPQDPANTMAYMYDHFPEEVVIEHTVMVYFDTWSFPVETIGFGFSPDGICDSQDSYSNDFGAPYWTTDGFDLYFFTINTEEHNEEYLCVKAVDTDGLTQYLVSNNPIQIDAHPPVVSISTDVSNELSNSKTLVVEAQDSHLHKIEYGISEDTNCEDSEFTIPDSSSSGFDHAEAVWRPWESGTFSDTVEVSGEYNGMYICVRAIDAAGRVSEVTSSEIVNLDSLPPVITVLDNVSEQETNSDVIQIEVYEEGNLDYIAYDFTVNNCEDLVGSDYFATLEGNHPYVPGDNSTYLSEYEFSIETEEGDDNYLCIFAVDILGNTSIYQSETYLNIDITPPDLGFEDILGNTPINDQELIIQLGEANLSIFAWGFVPLGSCNQNTQFIETISNPEDLDGDITIEFGEKHNGQYLCFMAIDIAGNVTFEQSVNPVDVDTTPPDIIIYLPPQEDWDPGPFLILETDEPATVTYGFSSNDDVCDEADEYYPLEDDTIFPWELTEGHVGEVLCLRAEDNAGNTTFEHVCGCNMIPLPEEPGEEEEPPVGCGGENEPGCPCTGDDCENPEEENPPVGELEVPGDVDQPNTGIGGSNPPSAFFAQSGSSGSVLGVSTLAATGIESKQYIFAGGIIYLALVFALLLTRKKEEDIIVDKTKKH